MFAIKQLLYKLNAQENVSLAPFSTMKVGGKTKFFVVISNSINLCELDRALKEHEYKKHILSGGSNTLFSDQDFLGVVIKLDNSFNYIKPINSQEFEVGASTSYAKLTKLFLSLGEARALGWLGTPGLVGGALRMNAGSSLGVIGDVVESITGVLDGQEITFYKKDLVYSYRTSNLPQNFIITKAHLKTSSIVNKESLLIKAQELKQKRLLTQPRNSSLGSFFKNPLPLFAGKLIENAGLKGFSIGDAQVSSIHANFYY
jgi:UDP-N-acetylmuramate dehydrogenase